MSSRIFVFVHWQRLEDIRRLVANPLGPLNSTGQNEMSIAVVVEMTMHGLPRQEVVDGGRILEWAGRKWIGGKR